MNDHWRNKEGSQEIHDTEWKWKHNIPKTVRYNEGCLMNKAYSWKGLNERGKKSRNSNDVPLSTK